MGLAAVLLFIYTGDWQEAHLKQRWKLPCHFMLTLHPGSLSSPWNICHFQLVLIHQGFFFNNCRKKLAITLAWELKVHDCKRLQMNFGHFFPPAVAPSAAASCTDLEGFIITFSIPFCSGKDSNCSSVDSETSQCGVVV